MTKKNVWRNRILIGLVVFAGGFAAGFVVRDRQQHKKIEELSSKVEQLGKEVVGRGKKASEALSEGTKGAADSIAGKKERSGP